MDSQKSAHNAESESTSLSRDRQSDSKSDEHAQSQLADQSEEIFSEQSNILSFSTAVELPDSLPVDWHYCINHHIEGHLTCSECSTSNVSTIIAVPINSITRGVRSDLKEPTKPFTLQMMMIVLNRPAVFVRCYPAFLKRRDGYLCVIRRSLQKIADGSMIQKLDEIVSMQHHLVNVLMSDLLEWILCFRNEIIQQVRDWKTTTITDTRADLSEGELLLFTETFSAIPVTDQDKFITLLEELEKLKIRSNNVHTKLSQCIDGCMYDWGGFAMPPAAFMFLQDLTNSLEPESHPESPQNFKWPDMAASYLIVKDRTFYWRKYTAELPTDVDAALEDLMNYNE